MANHMEHEQFFCPTFTSYSADNSAQTAARVATSAYIDNEDDLNFEFDLVGTDLSLDDVSLTGDCHVFPVFNRDISLDGCHVDESDSSTSSDTEEMFCVWWSRKSEETSCKKSKSSGSGSKRWKLLDLLKRSNSEGKGDLVFLAPKKKKIQSSLNLSAVEEFYVRRRASKEGEKRKSYLPYKKDLVGFFTKGM